MKPLILGPMATLSHEAFRRTVERFGGCDEYYTEMINASSLLNMGPFEKFYLMNGPCPEKIVWQLTGWNADQIAAAVDVVGRCGGKGIDINMGCSAPQIYKTGAGISWMLKPLSETCDLVRKVSEAVRKVSSETGNEFRLSVKCRLGDEKFTDEGLFEFTDMLAENGVGLVTIHPRTKKEKSHGIPRWHYAEELAQRYEGRMQVVLNGGIKDRATFLRAEETVPHSAGFMIARQAAVTPWIFAVLKKTDGEKTVIDRKQVALDFIDDVMECQPREFWKTRIQRFFSYYCQQFSFGHYFQSRMLNYKSVEESRLEIEDYFSKEEGDRFLEI